MEGLVFEEGIYGERKCHECRHYVRLYLKTVMRNTEGNLVEFFIEDTVGRCQGSRRAFVSDKHKACKNFRNRIANVHTL